MAIGSTIRRASFWVMYAAEQRRACFAETLARFRVDLELLAGLRALPDGDDGDDTPEVGVIPDGWHLKRVMGEAQVVPGQRWPDPRDLATRELVREALASTFAGLGLIDFDLGDALVRRREVTRPIARRAYQQGYAGIVYKSRLDVAFDCWAVFEGALIEVTSIAAIARDDADLVTIAEPFGLHQAR